jgi:hypothetical protein
MARGGAKSGGGSSMRDRMRQRLEERKSEGGGGGTVRLPDGVEFFNPEKGTYEIDHFPYIVSEGRNQDGVKVGEEWHRRIFWIHRNIGAEEKRYVCLKTIGKPCPICAEYSRLSKDRNADEEVVKALKPSERELYNILVDGKHYVFEMSAYLYGRIVEDELRNVDEQFLDYPMLKGGYTVKVRFGEKKLGKNSFLEAQRIDFLERDDLSDKWLDKAVDLDQCLNILTAEQLELVLYGADPEPEPDEEEPPARSTRRSAPEPEEEEPPTRSRRGAPEPEEEEPPTRSRRSAPEPEPEEEPAPTRSTRRNKPDPEPEPEPDAADNKCPHGYKFGVDNDAYDECDKCKVWEDCADEKDLLKRESRGGRKRG